MVKLVRPSGPRHGRLVWKGMVNVRPGLSPTAMVLLSCRINSKSHVCPATGQSTSGCKSRIAKPPEEAISQPPASIERWASKRGEANPQAAMKMNTTASKWSAVRRYVGRARVIWAKAEFRGMDSGAPRNHDGVEVTACGEGWLVNWGDPTAPDGVSMTVGSMSRYKAIPKAGTVRRESDGAIVPMIGRTTEPVVGKGPDFGDAFPARDG